MIENRPAKQDTRQLPSLQEGVQKGPSKTFAQQAQHIPECERGKGPNDSKNARHLPEFRMRECKQEHLPDLRYADSSRITQQV